MTEKEILASNQNPFLVSLKWSFQDDFKLYLVMEYIPGGELYTHLKRRETKRFTEEQTVFYAAEIILALEYLHTDLDIIYRDLKPENVLLTKQGHIKLTDFGLAKKKEISLSMCGTI